MPFSLTQQPLTLPPSLPCLHRPHSSSDSLSFLCLIFLVPLSLIRVSHSAASHCRSTAEGKGKWRQSLGESWSSLISHSSDKTRNSQSLSKLLSCPVLPLLSLSQPSLLSPRLLFVTSSVPPSIILSIPLLSTAVSHYLFCFCSNKRIDQCHSVFLLSGLHQSNAGALGSCPRGEGGCRRGLEDKWMGGGWSRGVTLASFC